MNLDLATLAGLLVTLSVASERLVEIIKGYSPSLNEEKDTKEGEARRKAALQFLAVLAGIATASLAWPAIKSLSEFQDVAYPWAAILALGLLASGGSGFWNSILTYVLQVKEIKKAEAAKVAPSKAK